MNAADLLRSRFRDEWRKHPDLVGLGTMLDNVLPCIGVADQKRAALEKSGTLTARGISDALRKDLATGVVPMLRKVRKTVADRQAALKVDRDALARPPIDKADIHALMMRQERRAYLRGLSHLERYKAANEASGDLAIAILEAPDMCGLDRDRVEKIREAYVEANHSAKVDALDDAAEALAVVGAAVDVAINDLRQRVEFDPGDGHSFDAWFDKAA